MRTFLNVPILDINLIYQMFAHHLINKFELIQTYQMVFMNFWYIEHYGACFRDSIDAKMNYFKHTNGYSMYIDYKQKN